MCLMHAGGYTLYCLWDERRQLRSRNSVSVEFTASGEFLNLHMPLDKALSKCISYANTSVNMLSMSYIKSHPCQASTLPPDGGLPRGVEGPLLHAHYSPQPRHKNKQVSMVSTTVSMCVLPEPSGIH